MARTRGAVLEILRVSEPGVSASGDASRLRMPSFAYMLMLRTSNWRGCIAQKLDLQGYLSMQDAKKQKLTQLCIR